MVVVRLEGQKLRLRSTWTWTCHTLGECVTGPEDSRQTVEPHHKCSLGLTDLTPDSTQTLEDVVTFGRTLHKHPTQMDVSLRNDAIRWNSSSRLPSDALRPLTAVLAVRDWLVPERPGSALQYMDSVKVLLTSASSEGCSRRWF